MTSGGSAGPPFRRLLVANRGEIAIRVFRTCREMGIETVAVHSEADAGAPFVRAADVARCIGPAPATESYLRVEAIVEAARDLGVDAIHPGYGFLSEQAAFAQAVEAAGIVFVGPAPGTLAGLGDKLAARRTAREAGVPILPGTFEPIDIGGDGADAQALDIAAQVGYPLLVKAAGGGGGRGMRRVDGPDALLEAARGAAVEAEGAFGSASVYLERYAVGARHVEVQLLGDAHGSVVALGERDCSTQRRHQKLVEEAPAPGLAPDQRRRLHALAVAIARSVGLRNAATAEFLLAPDGEVWFLEVNARLQVEHGVTELVTGLDLVREQLLVAAGQPLSPDVLAVAEAAAEPRAHAIELRISAEDPARGFAPMPGTLTRWREPAGPGIRMDSGVEEGMVVTGHYDPLLAKLLAVAPDRPRALARARRALGELETGGVQTTSPFHAWLLAHGPFVEGRLRTDLVETDWDPRPSRAAAERRAAAAVAAAWRPSLAGPRSVGSDAGDPWRMAARRDAVRGWRR
jgi:acetyl/propionyl-CoA carboxylase alpha subunit